MRSYHEVRLDIEALAALPAPTIADVVTALDLVPHLRAHYTAVAVVDAPHGPIAWHQYEHLIWALGESCRQLLKRKRSLRKEPDIWQRVTAIISESAFGKGRESFVMLLGQYGGLSHVPLLVDLLTDPEVDGHALYALRLLGAPAAVPRARELLHHPRAWVRREAKKYLAKVGGAASV